MSIDVSGVNEGQRKMWTIGDYPDIARTLTGVAETIHAHADARGGVSLLDVGRLRRTPRCDR
jgi:hypothetical protein